MIICIGADGNVAETGSYAELSAKKDGAFNKLMEWQMSGGETRARPNGPELTEEEELAYKVESGEAEHEGEEMVEEEGVKARGKDVTKSEAVAEKVKGRGG